MFLLLAYGSPRHLVIALGIAVPQGEKQKKYVNFHYGKYN